MHYIDELIALYAGRDATTRRYLLSSVSSVPLSFDTDTLLELLWRETTSAESGVRHQARRELGRVVPEFVLTEYGMHEMRGGVWTAFRGKSDRERARLEMQLAAMPREEADRLVSAGYDLFTPFLKRLEALVLQGSHRVQHAASVVLGRLSSQAVVDQLGRAVGEAPGNFALLAAAAELTHPAAAPLVRGAVLAGVRHEPDLVSLASALPEDDRLPLLEQLEGTGPVERWGVAQALAGTATDRGRALIDKLVKRREGWTTAYALDAVVARARERDLPLAVQAYKHESHEFLKVQAVKLVGHVPSTASVEFLLERLSDGTPRVQAAALEGLARQDVQPRRFTEQAERLLSSPLLRTRVNAMLLLGRSNPERVLPTLRELLFSDQAVHRLEAVYVLGYASGLEAVAVLAEVVASDGVLPVQMQALKSLAKQPAPLSADRLLALVRSPDPRLAVSAIRAALHQTSQVPGVIHEGLLTALAEVRAPAPQAVLLKAIGSATARRGGGPPPAPLVEYLGSNQAALVQGALEGLKFLGDHGFPEQARPLIKHADVPVRTRAALAGFLAGEVDCLTALAGPLESSDEAAVMSALSRLLEAAVMLPEAVRSARYNKLREALQSRLKPASAAPPEARSVRLPVDTASRPIEGLASPNWKPIKAPIANTDNVRLREIYSGRHKNSQKSTIEQVKLEDASFLVGFPEALAAVKRRVRPYAPLVAAAALMLVPLALWIWRAATDGDGSGFSVKGGPLPPGALRATFLQGVAKLKRAGKDETLPLGGEVLPGDTVSTEPRGSLTLDDGAGTSLWMGGASRISFAPPVDPAVYVFKDPLGDMHLDFKKVPVIEVSAGPARLVGRSVAFRIMDAGGVPHVMPGEGQLTLHRGPQVTPLEKGRPLPLH